MEATELSTGDEASVVSLWEEVGLTRPWNDASADFHRALTGPSSTILGLNDDGELIGTVMVGSDGHRGWVYYLAVRESRRGQGHGRMLMAAAEEWLREHGAVKVQLMVRNENEPVLEFYAAAGYERSDVQVLSRWIRDPQLDCR
ncbi:MAG: GNAT family acetyltransferase [Acidimicrobiales bacterium]